EGVGDGGDRCGHLWVLPGGAVDGGVCGGWVGHGQATSLGGSNAAPDRAGRGGEDDRTGTATEGVGGSPGDPGCDAGPARGGRNPDLYGPLGRGHGHARGGGVRWGREGSPRGDCRGGRAVPALL